MTEDEFFAKWKDALIIDADEEEFKKDIKSLCREIRSDCSMEMMEDY